jgi:aldehyde:ferredoxin oxidoreductase
MHGYMGTILRVNLSTRTINKEPLSHDLIERFVGGRGFTSKLLFDEVRPRIDPLGPENKIVIGVGACTGTTVPGSCRFTVASKSPMTNLLGDSNAGGFFGPELKYAGYDAVIIEGQAEEPVYLWVDNDRVEIRSAAHLWGKNPKETTRAIQRELSDPGISVIAIGPAGERLVRFANLITDIGRGLGRTGQGAVFGSKKLKAVAVRGSKGVTVANPSELAQAVMGMIDAVRPGKNPAFDLRARYGPAYGWPRYTNNGMFATRNYQGGAAWKNMMEPLDHYFVKQKACFSCPAGCDHLFVIPDGPYKGTYGGGLELTLVDFGPKMGNEDMDLLAKLHSLLDEYGIDYFETTHLIAFATECFERGILTKEDTGGLELRWGSAEAALTLVRRIVNREGFGGVLAEGLKRASESIGRGAEYYAMQAKGQGLTGRDPRPSKGWALAYAVSTRGPCHIRAAVEEGSPVDAFDASVRPILAKYTDPINPLLEEGKGELVAWYENLRAFQSCMEICFFSIAPWMVPWHSVPKALARFQSAVTGVDFDEAEILRIGERLINLEKAFNIREGASRRDDTLPTRFFTEPYPDGPAKGQVVHLEPMLDDYYTARGWDVKTGCPTGEKLRELNLDDVAEELGENS